METSITSQKKGDIRSEDAEGALLTGPPQLDSVMLYLNSKDDPIT